MKSLVFEQWQGGHYFNYLECLVPRLATICDEVVVAITEAARSNPLFDRQLGPLLQLTNVRFDMGVALPRPGSPLAKRVRIGRNLVEAIERHRPDFAFVPSADEHLLTLPLGALLGHGKALRHTSVEAVVHYKSYTSNANGREKLTSLIQRQLLNVGAISQLNFVNCLQHEAAVARGLALARIARVAGDPVPQPARIERGAARRALGLATDGRMVGMIGGLDERKAVPATLAAFRAASLGSSDRFFLAGKLVPWYAEMIRTEYADLVRDGSLIVLDRYLTEDELANCFAAVNLHCSVYNAFSGLSSLMLKSLAAGVPVLVSDRPGWSRAIVRRFQTGQLVDLASVENFAQAMRTALDDAERYSDSEAITRLLRFHSIDNFTQGLTERLRQRAGRPSSGPLLDWSWVVDALDPSRRTLV